MKLSSKSGSPHVAVAPRSHSSSNLLSSSHVSSSSNSLTFSSSTTTPPSFSSSSSASFLQISASSPLSHSASTSSASLMHTPTTITSKTSIPPSASFNSSHSNKSLSSSVPSPSPSSTSSSSTTPSSSLFNSSTSLPQITRAALARSSSSSTPHTLVPSSSTSLTNANTVSPSTSSSTSPRSSSPSSSSQLLNSSNSFNPHPPALSSSNHHHHQQRSVDRNEIQVKSVHQHQVNAAKIFELEDDLITHKNELDRRDELTAGLQRNCEALSLLCAQRLQELCILRQEVDENKLYIQQLQAQQSKFAVAESTAALLGSENGTLKEKLKAVENRLQLSDSHVSSLRVQLNQLTDVRDDLTVQLAKAQGLALSRHSECEEVRQELSSLRSKQQQQDEQRMVEQRQLQHEFENKEIEKWKDLLKDAEIRVQKTLNLLHRAEQDRDIVQSDVVRLKKSITFLRSEATQLRSELSDRDSQLTIARQQLESDAPQLKQHATVCRDLGDKVKFAERAKETLKKEWETVWSVKTDLECQLEQIKQDLHIAKTTIQVKDKHDSLSDAMKKQLEEVLTAKAKLEKTNADLSSQLSLMSSSLASTTSSLSTAQQQSLSLEQKVKDLTNRLNHSDEARAAAEIATATLDAHTAALREKMDKEKGKSEEEKSSVVQELERLKQKENEMSSKFNEVQQTLKRERELREREKEEWRERHHAELNEKLSAMQSNHSMLNARLLELQRKNDELTAIVDLPNKSQSNATRVSMSDFNRLKAAEAEIQITVAKLIAAEEATEASFTCYVCVNIFRSPITCIPCGHNYCLDCMKKQGHCVQCGSSSKVSYYPNEMLDELAAKYVFRKQALAALKQITSPAAMTATTAVLIPDSKA